jgi:hypothetical protein
MNSYEISYEKSNGKTDTMTVHATNVMNAIKDFEKIQADGGIFMGYNKYAIIKIELTYDWEKGNKQANHEGLARD